MEERIIQFIAALRAGGVRISLAESADAFTAVDRLGVQEREDFRLSLRATLVKDASGLPVFDELFPLFFDSSDAPPMSDVMEEMTPEEAQMLADMMRQFSEQLRQMMEKLLRGEQLSQQELDQLGQLTGLNRAEDMKHKDWYVQRMMRAMRFKEVQEAMKRADGTAAADGDEQAAARPAAAADPGQPAGAEGAGRPLRRAEDRREHERAGARPGKPGRADGPAVPRPVGQGHGRAAQGDAAAGQPAAHAHCPAPEAGQDRASWMPRARSGPISSMAACRWRSSIATTASSPSWW